MSSSENRFAEKLAQITGSYREPAKSVAEAAAAPATKTASIVDLSMTELMDHPSFEKGFRERLTERMPEMDAAIMPTLE